MTYLKLSWPFLLAGLFSILALCLALNLQQRQPELRSYINQACEKDPRFHIIYEDSPKSVIKTLGGFNLFGNGAIESTVCRPYTLSLKAKGEAAAGRGPILNITLNGTLLGQYTINGQQSIELFIPQSGRLVLSYLNDLYISDVRGIALKNFKFSGEICSSFTITKETDPLYTYSKDETISIFQRDTVKVVPCGEGRITFLYRGQRGGSAFPVMRIYTKTGTTKLFPTSSNESNGSLSVNTDGFYIDIQNPYARSLGDRNLFIQSLIFQ